MAVYRANSSLNLFRKKDPAAIISADSHDPGSPQLKKTLTARDLTAFGIAAIVGAGIFSTIGNASAAAGPAVILLFVFTGIACGFSALCYAEFASRVPVAGSAYTYAYVAFGELIAWIIGWDLLLEYAIGNIVVAISWSDYFSGFVNSIGDRFGFHIPAWLCTDYFSAKAASLATNHAMEAYQAWITAPVIGGIPIIFDLPALGIIFFITYLVYIGTSESRNATNAMVALKLGVIILVIIVGFFHINMSNWSPFAPNGISGVMKGVSAVFFAYIGFDAISTTAEECNNPSRDLPKGIFASLIICTILYILIALTLTGIIKYDQLAVGDPLAFVFSAIHLDWMSWIVALSAIVAIASVLLVFQMGQPRIWMTMSRDGLLPPAFKRIHPKYNTPSFATIVTGFVVSIPVFFMSQKELGDLTSIGTLFAFVLVCGGILMLNRNTATTEGTTRFRVPYINGKWIIPVMVIIGYLVAFVEFPASISDFFDFSSPQYSSAAEALLIKSPLLLFLIFSVIIAVLSFVKNLSLIPVLGLSSCFYLMTELGHTNWIRFIAWLIVGLVVYTFYGYRNSKLGKHSSSSSIESQA